MSRARGNAGSHPKIGPAQLAQVRRDGPAALRWQQRFGLAKATAMSTGLVVSGGVPLLGWMLLGWNAAAMLLFVAIDVVAVLLGDVVKLLLAGAQVRATHAEDHRVQQVLGIVGGLEDGTGRYTEHGRGLPPTGLFGVAAACALFLVPVLGAALEPLGLGPVRAAIDAPWFRECALGTLALHLLQSTLASLQARRHPPGESALYLDAGGVVGVFVGMAVLVWLPINWGAAGALALLAVMFAFRIAFGAFAWYWIPRVTRALQRRLAETA